MKSHTRKKFRNIVGQQVSKYRHLHGWSQTTLAEKCQVNGWEITRDVIANIETRERWVGDFEVVLLAKVLAVPVTDLLPDRINWQELEPALR